MAVYLSVLWWFLTGFVSGVATVVIVSNMVAVQPFRTQLWIFRLMLAVGVAAICVAPLVIVAVLVHWWF